MPNYNSAIGSDNIPYEMMPDEIVTQIIQDAPKSSVILTRAKQARMSTKKQRQPVLDTLPDAYWVGASGGMKQTSGQAWRGITMTAEELAVIVPIPDDIMADSSFDLTAEIAPRIAEAIGKKVDQAALFGVDKPDSWPTAIIPSAIAAGNSVAHGTGKDLGVDVASLAEKIAKQGFGINGFASRPGLQWMLNALRNTNGDPIYTTSLPGDTPTGLYGYPLNEVSNGAWNAETAELLMADWTKFVCGVRQDITYKVLTEAVITDDAGAVILNLAQQDMTALRVVFRVGFQCAIPLTRLAVQTKWAAETAYLANAVITANGNLYKCTTAGTSGAKAPTFPATGTVTDGTAVWTYVSANGYPAGVITPAA